MRHALLITAYKEFERLSRTVERLDDRFSVYIHIDLKSNISDRMLSELSSLRNTHVYRKFCVNWGGTNHLSALLFLAAEAQKESEVDFFHALSGQDMMVVSNDEFCRFFDSLTPPHNFITHTKLPSPSWRRGGFDRVDYFSLYDTFNVKRPLNRYLVNALITFQRLLHIKRCAVDLPLYGGGTWWSLHRTAIMYILYYLHDNPKFYYRFRHTFCAEEIVPQTILANSPLSQTLINDDLRFIDWSNRQGVIPSVLNASDFENIITSGKLFARKITSPTSDTLDAMITESIRAQSI